MKVSYRRIAEYLVREYDFDWHGNERMREACICSVENVIANVVNFLFILLLACVTGLGMQMIVFGITFAAMRIYAGGAHAKNHLYCIVMYVGIMLACIRGSQWLLNRNDTIFLAFIMFNIFFSGIVNEKYAATQKNVTSLCEVYQKKTMMIYWTLVTIICFLVILYIVSGNLKYKNIVILQSFAMITQSLALLAERMQTGRRIREGESY